MKKLASVCVLALLVTACAHHRDVRPGADGVHRVVVAAEDNEQGARDAIDQANHFCKQSEKYAAFVNEEQKYSGDMNEQSYKNAKRASKVAKGVGSAAYIFGGRNERALGGIVGIGGSVADGALGKGYTTQMKFRCIR
jgi:hypothetical protein